MSDLSATDRQLLDGYSLAVTAAVRRIRPAVVRETTLKVIRRTERLDLAIRTEERP
jgi:hypothetical protein